MFIVVDLRRKKIAFLMPLVLISVVLCIYIYMNRVQPVNAAVNQYKVYLTLDDGPSANTEKVLDILKENNIKATFFVVDQTEDYEVSLYQRIITEGHSLGLHSYTHDTKKIYESGDNYIEDFERLRDHIFAETGVSPKISRMVGGSHSKHCPEIVRVQVVDYFTDNGYACYDWDIDPLDSGAHVLPADTIAQNIIKAAEKKPNQDLVILLHDDGVRKTLPDALKIIIPYFNERNFVFDTLDSDTVLYRSNALVHNS